MGMSFLQWQKWDGTHFQKQKFLTYFLLLEELQFLIVVVL
jgi:hypothetical protein